jgi:DNA polymerase IV
MIACVRLPYFAAAVERQHDPALIDEPLVILRYGKKRGTVTAVSLEASSAGVTPGLSLTRARALCPAAQFVTATERYQGGMERLLRVLWSFTNRVEVDEAPFPQDAVCYLDLGQLKEADLRHIGTRLLEAIRTDTGIDASVGIATGKFPAYLAAYSTTAVELIPPGNEAAFAAPFPVAVLPLSKETARRLRLFCIRTLGEMAAFSKEALVAQFGKSGRRLYQLANGRDGRLLKVRRMPAVETVLHRFDAPIESQDRLDVHLHQIAGLLSDRLETRQSALHAITLSIGFETGDSVTESLHLLLPIASAKGIAEVMQQLMERMKQTAGIASIEVQLSHLVPNIPRQLELFTDKPVRQQVIQIADALVARHGAQPFYWTVLDHPYSLFPERRFELRRVDVS